MKNCVMYSGRMFFTVLFIVQEVNDRPMDAPCL